MERMEEQGWKTIWHRQGLGNTLLAGLVWSKVAGKLWESY